MMTQDTEIYVSQNLSSKAVTCDLAIALKSLWECVIQLKKVHFVKKIQKNLCPVQEIPTMVTESR